VRALLLLVVGASLALGGCAEEPPLSFAPERLDFGTVPHGGTKTASFRLRAAGEGTFYVNSITPNCSCLQIGPYLRTLRAGDEVEVPVTFVTVATSPERMRGKKIEVVVTQTQGGGETPHRLVVPVEGEVLPAS
jgi:hypothetical protein